MKKDKQLILYITSSGTTKNAAQVIQQYTNANLVELMAEPPYPTDYESVVDRGRTELHSATIPKLDTSNLPSLEKYDEIFIGFPIWWDQPPMLIYSLFDELDFSNKTIIPFATSMSSTIDSSIEHINSRVSKFNNTKLTAGIRYTNKENLKKFLITNNLI